MSEEIEDQPVLVDVVKPVELSKGEIFRRNYGITPTLRRNMERAGFNPVLLEHRKLYRKQRNAKKKAFK